MKVAIAEGHPVTLSPAATIADGIAVRRAGEKTLPLIQKYVDDIVTVDEEEIANAILLLLEREKTLAEGAGAAAIAALINRKTPLSGKKIAVLVCGGNIDVSLLSRIMERGLARLPRSSSSPHWNSGAASRQHRRNFLRSRLLRRESRRHRHRHHHGNSRSRPYSRTAFRPERQRIHA
jgi:hypothetical protein